MRLKNTLFAILLLSMGTIFAQNKNTPMMGWSSWNTFRININEDLIKQTADAMVEKGLKDAGYTYVNIDDGFFYGRDDKGNLQVHPEKFPNGLKAVADHIHSLGLKAGIYSDVGIRTCGSMWDNDKYGLNTGLWNHEDRDCDLFFNRWGYDYIKVDFCGGEKVSDDKRKTDEEKYMAVWNAVKRTGKDIRFNVCRWRFPGTWVTEIPGSWRISHDIGNNFDKKLGVIDILEHNLYLAAYASPGHFNDMDMMQIGRRTMTEQEEMSHFGIWCIMNSPLMIGCDLRTIPESTLKIITNKEVIAVNQDVLGLQAKLVSRAGKQFVLAKPLEEKCGTIRAVALVNAEAEPKVMRITFEDIQLIGKVKVRDLWKHENLGEFKKHYEVEVPAHGTAMLRLEGEMATGKSVYEAEYAFINEFVGDGVEGKARFVKDDSMSGGAKVIQIGNSETNWIEFRDIYSEKNRLHYGLNIHYMSDEPRDLTITINGEERQLKGLQSGGKNIIKTQLETFALKKGENIIRLGNTNGYAPDIDKIEIVPVQISASSMQAE